MRALAVLVLALLLPAFASPAAAVLVTFTGNDVCVEEPPYPTSPGYSGGYCTSFTDDDLCSVEHYWDDPNAGSGQRCMVGSSGGVA